MKESGVEITYPDISLFQEKAAVATEEAVAEFNARQLELYNTILSVKDKYQ
jgi:NACalpha-BTF3-like transcription factor